MIIRKATLDDAKTLNEFLTLLIKDEKQYDSGINENFIVTNMYENYIEDPDKMIAVAEENDKIVGYIYGYIKSNDGVYLYATVKLDALYVDPNYRNRGIATSLIDYFKNWTIEQNLNDIEISVCSRNNAAKSLYNKLGFITTKEIMINKISK